MSEDMKDVVIETQENPNFKFLVRAYHKPSGIKVVKEKFIAPSFNIGQVIEMRIMLRNETLKELRDLLKDSQIHPNNTK